MQFKKIEELEDKVEEISQYKNEKDTQNRRRKKIGKLEEQLKRSNNCIKGVPEGKNEENKREEIMWVFVVVVFSQKISQNGRKQDN